MPAPSLLAAVAHPEDESLSAGGVLACHATSGARTAVVTATWATDAQRAAELAEALRCFGAEAPRMLNYATSRVPESALGRARFRHAPLDEAVGQDAGAPRLPSIQRPGVRPDSAPTTATFSPRSEQNRPQR